MNNRADTAPALDESQAQETWRVEHDETTNTWTLFGHRMRHSVVRPAAPTAFELDYVKVVAAVLDAVPGQVIRAVHVGGGARTLPRYIAATRPGSVQTVIEPAAAVNAVSEQLPPIDHLTVLETAGRSGLALLPPGAADVVIVDAFHRCRVPASLTTVEATAEYARVLDDDGVLVLNLVDTCELHYLHRVLDTIQSQFTVLAAFGDGLLESDRAFGNVVVVAGRNPRANIGELPRRAVEAGFHALDPVRRCPDAITHMFTDATRETSPLVDW